MMSMISVEEARSIVLEAVEPMQVETIPFMESLGRVLAVDALSDIDVSPFDNSSMDGFAVHADDVATASESQPVELQIVAHIGAGDTFEGIIGEGQCARIMTGALMPEGPDTVIKIEEVTFSGEGGVGEKLIISAPAEKGKNVRLAGEEVARGQAVLKAGEVITPAAIGLLAATGNTEVQVYSKPRVGIMSNGSELVDPDQEPQVGKIRDSNKYALAAFVKALGIEPILYPIVGDTLEELEEAWGKAARECDVVISSGGACGGDFDYSPQVIAALGEQRFSRINMRPGKAQSFTVGDGVLLFGLSGNPAAAIQGFRMVVQPALLRMLGHDDPNPIRVRARLAADIKKRDMRRFYMLAKLTQDDDGTLTVEAQRKQSSALLGVQYHSNCMIVFPEGETFRAAGDLVDCVML